MAGLLGRASRGGRLQPARLISYSATLLVLFLAAACNRAAATPSIQLTDTAIEVTGLPDDVASALENAKLTDEQWPSVLRVAVSADAPAMLGSYAVDDDVVRFTPAFPLDAGRQYQVTFDGSKVPGIATGGPLTATVGRPASTASPTTVVSHVYPSGDVVPENTLRMYIEFSAPMGRKSGVEYIKLLNQSGQEIEGAVLPLDYEFWSPDHKRFTVFFDPGRVKQGILPNRQMGRAFTPGQTATLVISREWRDEHGQPLKEEFRRTFQVTPADEQPLDTKHWVITAPAASGRSPVTVRFPKALDHGLLMRALGIRRNGQPVEGDIQVAANETQWSFTPRDAWQPGTYQVLALDILEDIAGNQIGRAFEVDNFDTVDKSPNPESVLLPFTVR